MLVLKSCLGCNDDSNNTSNAKPKFVKSPIDKLITKYIDKSDYTVILSDMDYKESEDKYYHKYQIIIQEEKPELTKNQLLDSTVTANDIKVVDTDWEEVSPIIFEDYQNDLGMTILNKENGVLDKHSAPAGGSSYVGNPRYGEWETHSNGSSFWSFYGRYYFLSRLFFGPSYGYGGYYGYSRNDWGNYSRNYKGTDNYYGKNGQHGTRSKTRNTSSSWNKKSSSFKDKVSSKVSRSSNSLKSRGYTSSKSYSKTTRNSNRFSSSSTSRSRSGGFGK